MSRASDAPFGPYAPGNQPSLNDPDYGSTQKRHPISALVRLPACHTATELTALRFLPARLAAQHPAAGRR